MFRFFHAPLSPFCRKVRLVLSEKKLEFELIEEKYWEKREDFLALNPFGQVPVLQNSEITLAESSAICEYLNEKFPDPGRETFRSNIHISPTTQPKLSHYFEERELGRKDSKQENLLSSPNIFLLLIRILIFFLIIPTELFDKTVTRAHEKIETLKTNPIS